VSLVIIVKYTNLLIAINTTDVLHLAQQEQCVTGTVKMDVEFLRYRFEDGYYGVITKNSK
jgi:hypothetical protein